MSGVCPDGPGKTSWPELVGELGTVAKETIEKENPQVTAVILKEGTPIDRAIICNRVRVWVNDEEKVTRVPVSG